MSCPCEFKAELPSHCLGEIFSIVTGGEIAAKRYELIQHILCASGSLTAMIKKWQDGDSADDDTLPPMASLQTDDIAKTIEAIREATPMTGEAIELRGNPVLKALILRLIDQLGPLLVEQLKKLIENA